MSAILREDRAPVNMHVQFQPLFEQLHVLGSIHSGVRQNEIQTSSAKEQRSTPNHLAWWLFHCGYDIFLVKTLTQWPPNVHEVRYKLLHGVFVTKQHFLPLSESPMAMTSGKVQSFSYHHWCQVWLSCQPMGLQSKFFAETSRNSAGTYCCTRVICNSVVRAFAHGAMGRRIDPSWWSEM